VKFYEKGNKSAGTRVRKNMNELKKKAQEIRKEVPGNQGPGEDARKGRVSILFPKGFKKGDMFLVTRVGWSMRGRVSRAFRAIICSG